MSQSAVCHLRGCQQVATNTCSACGERYCDGHMLVAKVADAQGALVTVEVCFADLSKASELATEHGAQATQHVTHWHRKSEPA